MNITIIGTGYVGLPSGVGFAELGHNVICVDREKTKIELLQCGKVTLYEDGLEELLQRNLKRGNIKFTTSMMDGVKNADIIIIAVGTPPHPVTHEADMQYVHAAAVELAGYLDKYTVIATKSTVPVGTGDVIETLIRKTRKDADFDVVSLPEFLREGKAIHDFFNPDRIVVGTESSRAFEVIRNIYKNLLDSIKIIRVSRRSSELIKYASNSFLAIKIHYINEIADLCEKTDANIMEVATGMGLDKRIGNKFLNPGPGFGGSCFPKDTMALSYMAKQNDVILTLVEAAITGNHKRKIKIANEIISTIKKFTKIKKVGFLGFAFKAGTDDCRQSPAIDIIEKVIRDNTQIKFYGFDPKANTQAQKILNSKIEICNSTQECVKNVDLIVILTEWSEFKVVRELASKEQLILDYRYLLENI